MYCCFRWIATIALPVLVGAGCARTEVSAAAAVREPDFGWASMERPTDATFARKAPVYAFGAAGRVDIFDTRKFTLLCRIAPPKDGPKEGELWRIALSPDGAVHLVFIGVPSDTKGAPNGWVLRNQSGAWRKSADTPGAP